MNPPMTKNKPSILLADDSKLVRFTANKVLGDEFDLILTENGAEAWESVCANESIQLVLTDMQMPVLDGLGLLAKIRQSDDERISRLPVIMVTGADKKDGPKEQAMEQGATDFIGKPFEHADLKARVRAHVGHQQNTQSLMAQVNTDPVTGCPNLEAFEDRLAKDLAFTARHHHSIAVMLVQLDAYKTLYETIGRGGYNKVVQQVGKLLQRSVRKEDTVARAELSQFLISLPTADPDAISGLAHRIAGNAEAYEIKLNDNRHRLSLSIGVFTVPKGCSADANTVLNGAREALAQALQQGSGQISVRELQKATDKTPMSLDQLLAAVRKNGVSPASINAEQLADALKPLVELLPAPLREQLCSTAK